MSEDGRARWRRRRSTAARRGAGDDRQDDVEHAVHRPGHGLQAGQRAVGEAAEQDDGSADSDGQQRLRPLDGLRDEPEADAGTRPPGGSRRAGLGRRLARTPVWHAQRARPSNGPGPWPGSSASSLTRRAGSHHPHAAHATHAAHAAAARHGRRLLLGLVGDEALGGEDQGGDRRRVLQRRPGDLGRVDDAGLDQVLELAGGGVEADGAGLAARPARTTTAPSRPALSAMSRAGASSASAHGAGTGGLVARRATRRRPGTAARARSRAVPPPATTPSSMAARVADRASSMRCFFSLSSTSVAAPTLMTATPPASLARRSWSFSRSQSESVFSISALIWSMRPLTSSSVAATVDDGGVVLGDDDLLGRAEQVERDVLELEADLLADDLATGEDGHVLQHRLAAVAEAGGLDGDGVERAADLVDDEGGQGLALDVLGDDQQRPAGLHDLLEHRQQGLDRGDLAAVAAGCTASSRTASWRSGSVTKYGDR